MGTRLPRLVRAAAVGAVSLAALLLAWPGSARVTQCASPEIRVYKREGVLELWCGGAKARTMGATFGANPLGPKEREGDERTPEGTYRIAWKAKSERFHRFLAISYPNDEDRARARRLGIKDLGGGIGVHGTRTRLAPLARLWTRFARGSGMAGVWGPTDGCIGLANEDVEMLFDVVPAGSSVTIAASR